MWVGLAHTQQGGVHLCGLGLSFGVSRAPGRCESQESLEDSEEQLTTPGNQES